MIPPQRKLPSSKDVTNSLNTMYKPSPMNHILFAILLICLTGCSSAHNNRSFGNPTEISHEPDPVAVIYHVKAGAEKDLESLLEQTWKTYLVERMVRAKPHVC